MHGRDDANRSERYPRPVESEPERHRAGQQHDADVRRQTGVAECARRCRSLHRSHEEGRQRDLARLEQRRQEQPRGGRCVVLEVVRTERGGNQHRQIADLVRRESERRVVPHRRPVVVRADEERAGEPEQAPARQGVHQTRRSGDQVEAQHQAHAERRKAPEHELAVEVPTREGQHREGQQRAAYSYDRASWVRRGGAEQEDRHRTRQCHAGHGGPVDQGLAVGHVHAVVAMMREGHILGCFM